MTLRGMVIETHSYSINDGGHERANATGFLAAHGT